MVNIHLYFASHVDVARMELNCQNLVGSINVRFNSMLRLDRATNGTNIAAAFYLGIYPDTCVLCIINRHKLLSLDKT